MSKTLFAAVLAVCVLSAAAADVTLVSFDGADVSTNWKWRVVNDPVMGGQSTSTFSIDTSSNKSLSWAGETKIVPSLKAPGFCNLETTDKSRMANDASGNTHMKLRVRTTTAYDGWKVSFAADTVDPQFKSFKAGFNLTADGAWHTVAIPFTDFSNDWSPYTGRCDTLDPTGKQHKCCSADHPEVCVTEGNKKDIQQIGLWTEGTAGAFNLEVAWIAAGTVGEQEEKAAADPVVLAKFDGADQATKWSWKVVNDPVMGGKSTSTFTIDEQTNKSLSWAGETKVVPSLKAPGFCNLETTDWFRKANDASGTTHLMLRARTTTAYDGWKISFAADTLNPQFKSFKAGFNLTADGAWHTVAIPFTEFSNDWSSYTGRCDTVDPSGKTHTCCSTDHPEVCPSEKNKKDIQQIGLWTEGTAGAFNLELQWIAAGTPSPAPAAVAAAPAGWTSSCMGPVQPALKYNVGGRDADIVTAPVAPAAGEDLASAVCCDERFYSGPFPEPNGFFARPDVDLFAQLDANKTTTFYDSVCGIPLFTAPVGRSFEAWQAETVEHGWPSFRPAEMVAGNVRVEGGLVVSKCGTHLGSFLPDDQGDRYCLDLVCLAGVMTE